jgi:hypothetical protein
LDIPEFEVSRQLFTNFSINQVDGLNMSFEEAMKTLAKPLVTVKAHKGTQ